MDELPDRTRKPLTGEVKVAVGCLAILALQQTHEAWLFVWDLNSLGNAHLGPLSLLALVIVIGTGVGLMQGSRRAWWSAMLFIGGCGLLHLLLFASPLLAFGETPAAFTRVYVTEYEWLQGPRLHPFGFFWVVSRGILLLACPLVLLLGELRRVLDRP